MARSTSIEELRQEIANLLPTVGNEDILREVRDMLGGNAWWDDEAEAESIAATEEDIKAGNLVGHREVMEDVRRWIKK